MRGPTALALLANDGDEMLRRAVEIELKLAVLIDRAKRRDRRRPLAVLAEALAPELHVPGGETRQAVAVGKHHIGAHATFLGQADGDARRRSLERIARALLAFSIDCDHGLSALAQRHRIEPTRQGRQEPDIGQAGEAAANIRIVVERGDGEGLAQRAQAVLRSFRRGLGDGEEQLGDALGQASLAHGVDGGR